MFSQNDHNNFSRRSFLTRGTVGASLLCLPTALWAKYEAEADANSNDVVIRFAAMSDVHFKKNPDCVEADRFLRSMQFMYDYSSKQQYKKFDALLVAGDMSDHGWDEELLFFKSVMDKGIQEGTTTILCMGNHEFIDGSKARWEEIFERDSNKVYDVNGFKFVALSPERGSCRDGDYLYALDWFEKSIADACADDSGKPVFTFQHYHVTPTVYGSRGEDNWGTRDLYDTLQKYPRVIDFSGHSHYPINDPRSVWQGRFTAFGTGTLSYFEMGGEGGRYNKFPKGYHDAAQMYVVEVRRDNSVVLKPYDLISNSFFDVVYAVAQPGAIDKYVYTDERYKTSSKPKWTESADAKLIEATADVAVVSFPQAVCPDVVHSYRADIRKKNGDEWEDFGAQYFWSEYYFKNYPKEMKIEIDGLDELSTYQADITALNPFFKESDEKLTVEFKTAKDLLETVDKNAPAPDANMLDIKFVDGRVVNEPKNALPEQKAIEINGAPKIVKDAELNDEYVAVFSGKADRFKIKFNSRDYNKLRRGTIAARFKFDSFGSDKMDVLANTEGAGVSFELNNQTKELELWMSVNGRYVTLSAPVETGRYIDAFGTYDGAAVVFYLDGKEVARREVAGKLTHPASEAVQAFCVGSDIGSGGGGNCYFNGSIARARVFTWALTAEQVANLSK